MEKLYPYPGLALGMELVVEKRSAIEIVAELLVRNFAEHFVR